MASNPAHLFQPGNTLASKVKVIDGMIRSVLAQDDRGRLRKAVERTLDQAADGSLPHLDWLACRLEGKAVASLQVSDHSPQLRELSFRELATIVAMQAQATPDAADQAKMVIENDGGEGVGDRDKAGREGGSG